MKTRQTGRRGARGTAVTLGRCNEPTGGAGLHRVGALTKYVGFDGEREVCVRPEDVHRFGDGDVLKVLPIDLHDLEQEACTTH